MLSKAKDIAFAQATQDTQAPTECSVIINSATAAAIDSELVHLILSATDNTSVTGYYLAQNDAKPSITDSAWRAVTSTTSYRGYPAYRVSSGNGSKTVYAWFKDAAGNISNAASDTITLEKNDSWKNHYTVWFDGPNNAVRYAKQMGYAYINAIGWQESFYKNTSNAAGMKFYLLGPHLRDFVYSEIPGYSSLVTVSNIDSTIAYTPGQQAWYEKYMLWKSYDAFPDNLASGWFNGSPTKYSSMWDFQQQAVIDYVVDKIIANVGGYESASLPFSFAGYQFDVPDLSGDFFYWDNGMRKINLTTWTEKIYGSGNGKDSGVAHVGVNGTSIKDYDTYADGLAAFFKQLMARTRQKYPNAKLVLDPARIYSDGGYDEWIHRVSARTDKDELTPDLIMEEGATTQFVDSADNFNSGMDITRDMVGNHQRSAVDEKRNRLIAAKAGMNHAWYNILWGNLGGQGNMPRFPSIVDVYPRLKLASAIPNWDNLNSISNRTCSECGKVELRNSSAMTVIGSNNTPYNTPEKIIYDSYDASGRQQSHIDQDVMYSRHWKTGKLFAVFNTTNGVINLKPGERVQSVQRVDGYFVESTGATGDFIDLSRSQIALKSTVAIPTDSSNNAVTGSTQVVGLGYIFAVTGTGNAAPAITSALIAAGTVGTALSYQITATNSPTSFNATGLPAGLSVSAGGLISGTPATIGTSSVTVSAANSSGTGSASLALSVYSACDVNRDWSTNVVDVQLQVNAALGVAACASDLDRDGSCSVIDVQRGVNAGLGGPCVLGP